MERLIHRRATEADSAALCELMRETPMGESLRTIQDRGDDFFAASRLQADELEIWAAFEENSGRAAGIFSAEAREVFLNGEIKSVRYLSDLRIRPEYRSSLLLARGFKILRREVFGDGEWAQTLVLDDNAAAAALLTSGRGGLPEYRPCGRYRTWFLRQQGVSACDPEIKVRKARPADLDGMQQLQDQVGAGADYTPVLDFSTMQQVEFFLASKARELVGMLGIWDLSAHRSTVIESYSRPLRLARPLYNFWAKIRKLPRLPATGAKLNAKAITAVLCRDRDPKILRALLAAALQRPGLFAIGLDAEDPLTEALTGLRSRTTTAGHYLVGFWGEPPEAERPFYFDFARL